MAVWNQMHTPVVQGFCEPTASYCVIARLLETDSAEVGGP